MSKLTKEVGRQVYTLTYFQYYYRHDFLWKNIISESQAFVYFFPLQIMNVKKFQRRIDLDITKFSRVSLVLTNSTKSAF